MGPCAGRGAALGEDLGTAGGGRGGGALGVCEVVDGECFGVSGGKAI